jgi:hypothetical protein
MPGRFGKRGDPGNFVVRVQAVGANGQKSDVCDEEDAREKLEDHERQFMAGFSGFLY